MIVNVPYFSVYDCLWLYLFDLRHVLVDEYGRGNVSHSILITAALHLDAIARTSSPEMEVEILSKPISSTPQIVLWITKVWSLTFKFSNSKNYSFEEFNLNIMNHILISPRLPNESTSAAGTILPIAEINSFAIKP
jgi:hypothetical protein